MKSNKKNKGSIHLTNSMWVVDSGPKHPMFWVWKTKRKWKNYRSWWSCLTGAFMQFQVCLVEICVANFRVVRMLSSRKYSVVWSYDNRYVGMDMMVTVHQQYIYTHWVFWCSMNSLNRNFFILFLRFSSAWVHSFSLSGVKQWYTKRPWFAKV